MHENSTDVIWLIGWAVSFVVFGLAWRFHIKKAIHPAGIVFAVFLLFIFWWLFLLFGIFYLFVNVCAWLFSPKDEWKKMVEKTQSDKIRRRTVKG